MIKLSLSLWGLNPDQTEAEPTLSCVSLKLFFVSLVVALCLFEGSFTSFCFCLFVVVVLCFFNSVLISGFPAEANGPLASRPPPSFSLCLFEGPGVFQFKFFFSYKHT